MRAQTPILILKALCIYLEITVDWVPGHIARIRDRVSVKFAIPSHTYYP
ncbi:unnamed protein product [Toxocara canis]|uniref:Uncharacterized protein n=1 Tax=Toxocara canis TaxID=6265 RepID=A0A3P7EL23_TOXCA|nr:unnamed protein product [Toxocara canis]